MTMAFRLALLILLVSLAAVSMVARSNDLPMVDAGVVAEPDGHGLGADVLELDEELMMESDSARRQLARASGRGYIGYGALRRNTVPCNQRGKSYYNCRRHQRANPYKRGCTRASRCARNNR